MPRPTVDPSENMVEMVKNRSSSGPFYPLENYETEMKRMREQHPVWGPKIETDLMNFAHDMTNETASIGSLFLKAGGSFD